MKTTLIALFGILILMGCRKLDFDGDYFLTTKGRLIDPLGNPVSGVKISLHNAYDKRSTVFNNPRDTNFLISNSTISSQEGAFQITFPKSNGVYYLLLPKPYRLDSVPPTIYDSLAGQFFYVDTSLFNNYFQDVHDIKIRKQ